MSGVGGGQSLFMKCPWEKIWDISLLSHKIYKMGYIGATLLHPTILVVFEHLTGEWL